MSFVMNPQQVKRREYLGLSGLLIGAVHLVAGLICLLFSMPIGLLVLGFGTAAFSAGIFVLSNIPDVVGPREDLW